MSSHNYCLEAMLFTNFMEDKKNLYIDFEKHNRILKIIYLGHEHMVRKFVDRIGQRGISLGEKIGFVGAVLTGGVIAVNAIFHLHLSQYLRQIPLLSEWINIDLIEEFERIQDGDPFYEELKAHLAMLGLDPRYIQDITVRTDSSLQETFKVTLKDGTEQRILIKKTLSGYAFLKHISQFQREQNNFSGDVYYFESGVQHIFLGSAPSYQELPELYVPVGVSSTDRQNSGSSVDIDLDVAVDEAYQRGKLDGMALAADSFDSQLDCPSPTACPSCEDNYDLGYQDGYAAGSNISQVDYQDDAVALCQKSMEEQYNLGYLAGKSEGEEAGYQAGYDAGYLDGSQQTTNTTAGDYDQGYNQGYSAGYDAGYNAASNSNYQQGYDDGVASCTTSSAGTYEDGYKDGYGACSEAVYQTAYDEGYSQGYVDGTNSCYTPTGP